MDKKLTILAIDDAPHKLEQRVYKPMKAALAAKGITLDYKVVEHYGDAIKALEGGFRPDVITQDYLIYPPHGELNGGEVGPHHLDKILEYIDTNIPGYSPQPFMLTYSSSEASVAVHRMETLLKHNTQVIEPGDMTHVRDNLELPEVHPLERSSAFSRYLQQRFGDDIVTSPPDPVYEPQELKGLEKIFAEAGDIPKELPRLNFSDELLRKSLLPQLDAEEEARTHRLQCLKSNHMLMHGHAAFTAADVDRLAAEDKRPVLFIQDYDMDTHAPLLAKVAGIVCLGSGGSHLLERGIPAIGKAKKELWDRKTGAGIDLCRIEQTADGPAVVNNAHAVIRAISEQPAGAAAAPQPDYDHKNKLVLFKAGDEVTIANAAAYQGHLWIEQPDLEPTLEKLRELKAGLPFKQPKFLANMPSRKNFNDAAIAADRALNAGAEGFGLVRSEYMLDDATLQSVKQGILQNDPSHYACLGETDAINGVLAASFSMDSPRPVRIRLFDFPPDEIFSGDELKTLKARVGDVPSGTPLALVTDGLYEAQLKAIFTKAKREYEAPLEIMAPHVRNAGEMQKIRMMVEKAAEEAGFPREQLRIGTMLETLSACEPNEAAKLAKLCDFASFGTNDLTQEVTGIARSYNGDGVNPYQTLDDRVKQVMEKTTAAMRKSNPRISLSCCGGQMRDLDSLTFAAGRLGLDEVSVPDDAFHLIGRQLQLMQQLALQQEQGGSKAADVATRKADAAGRQR